MNTFNKGLAILLGACLTLGAGILPASAADALQDVESRGTASMQPRQISPRYALACAVSAIIAATSGFTLKPKIAMPK